MASPPAGPAAAARTATDWAAWRGMCRARCSSSARSSGWRARSRRARTRLRSARNSASCMPPGVDGERRRSARWSYRPDLTRDAPRLSCKSLINSSRVGMNEKWDGPHFRKRKMGTAPIFLASLLQPVADQEERAPVVGMAVARILQRRELRLLQRLSLRDAWVAQRAVEVRNDPRRGGVVDGPERRHGAARAGLDRHAGKPERGAVVAGCGFAGRKRQELDRLGAEFGQPEELLELGHRQAILVGQEKGLVGVARELAVGGDVHDRVRRRLEILFHVRHGELAVAQHGTAV